MNDDNPDIDFEKRKLLKRNFENSYHLNNKRNNFGVPCKGLRCEQYDQLQEVSNDLSSDEDGDDRCPGTLYHILP